MEKRQMQFVLEMPDGTEKEFEVIGVFGVEDRDYMALEPVGASGAEAYLIGFHAGPEDEIVLDPIEDDEEYAYISKVFLDLFNQEETELYDLQPMYEEEDALLESLAEEEEYCFEDAEGRLFLYDENGGIVYLNENGEFIWEDPL